MIEDLVNMSGRNLLASTNIPMDWSKEALASLTVESSLGTHSTL
jgi:hypothetical protein